MARRPPPRGRLPRRRGLGDRRRGRTALRLRRMARRPPARAAFVTGHPAAQPVEPLEEWESPPFTPAERDGLLLARGASDDKGQVLFHALGVRAGLAAHGTS